MTQEELLRIISNGVEEWNEKRELGEFFYPKFHEVDFRKYDLEKIDFYSAYFFECNFGDIILEETNFNGATIDKSNFEGSDLKFSNFRGTDIIKSNFRECNLLESDFDGSKIKDSNFSKCYMDGTSFAVTEFINTEFTESEILYCSFGFTNLDGIKGINECKFLGPSIIDFETLQSSESLDLNTLRGLGLPDNLIEYLPSFREQPIQYYSCFISFTEKDDTFSLRLYNDLQGKGIRCWKWNEDAKWGEKLISEIDKAVKLHDKLIVVLSEDSLKSEPVIREIERALQRESKLVRKGERKSVLFPIRVDDSIFSWDHPLQADLVERNIGDFRSWRDHDSYQKAFKKLMKDLKAE